MGSADIESNLQDNFTHGEFDFGFRESYLWVLLLVSGTQSEFLELYWIWSANRTCSAVYPFRDLSSQIENLFLLFQRSFWV